MRKIIAEGMFPAIKRPLAELGQITERNIRALYELGYRIFQEKTLKAPPYIHLTWQIVPPVGAKASGKIRFSKAPYIDEAFSVLLYPELPRGHNYGQALLLLMLSLDRKLREETLKFQCIAVTSFRLCQRLSQYQGISFTLPEGQIPRLWQIPRSLDLPRETYLTMFREYQEYALSGQIATLRLDYPRDFVQKP